MTREMGKERGRVFDGGMGGGDKFSTRQTTLGSYNWLINVQMARSVSPFRYAFSWRGEKKNAHSQGNTLERRILFLSLGWHQTNAVI